MVVVWHSLLAETGLESESDRQAAQATDVEVLSPLMGLAGEMKARQSLEKRTEDNFDLDQGNGTTRARMGTGAEGEVGVESITLTIESVGVGETSGVPIRCPSRQNQMLASVHTMASKVEIHPCHSMAAHHRRLEPSELGEGAGHQRGMLLEKLELIRSLKQRQDTTGDQARGRIMARVHDHHARRQQLLIAVQRTLIPGAHKLGEPECRLLLTMRVDRSAAALRDRRQGVERVLDDVRCARSQLDEAPKMSKPISQV